MVKVFIFVVEYWLLAVVCCASVAQPGRATAL